MLMAQRTIEQLSEEIGEFCRERDWDQFHNPKDLAIGISTEASELLEIFRFKSDAQIREMFDDECKRSEISDELADVFYFVLRFAQITGLDLSDILEKKLAKNRERYPADMVRGKNLKYNEY